MGRSGAVTHGTTVVAIRYADGVVMAGDRRATSGHLISHRSIEKVFPADRWSGVAIAGAAGPAMEMVKLFQLQLEHYEKVEGWPLSLEGKATVHTDIEAVRDAELRYAQRYRTPRPNPKRVVIEVRVEAMPCVQCAAPQYRIREHVSVAAGLRRLDVICRNCGAPRSLWFRIVLDEPN